MAMDLGSPEPKGRQFVFVLPKSQNEEPRMHGGKNHGRIIVRLVPKSTCKFLHPDIGIYFLNPRVQPLYCRSLGAEICTLTSAIPRQAPRISSKKICFLPKSRHPEFGKVHNWTFAFKG